MKTTHSLALTALLTTLTCGAASAQDGFIGVNFGTISGSEIDDDEEYSGQTGAIEGSVGYDFGQVRVIFDGRARLLDLSVNEVEDLDGDSGPESSLFALHALYGVRETMDLGMFAAAGVADNGEGDGKYELSSYGIEAHYKINDAITAYGQLAKFEATRDDNSPNGTQDGTLVRLGANYSGFETTTLYADVQWASAADYEDNGEDYEFHTVSIGGETMLGGTQFAMTYDVALFGSTPVAGGDPDSLRSTEASLGIRYYFGNTQSARASGHIGAPSLISETNILSELHD